MPYRDQNDETLVLLTLAGEQRAYEVLVSRYERAVKAAAYSVLQSRYLSEDAAQDAFVTAWMKLGLLRERNKFGVWVCRIAKNCARNTVRRYRAYMSLDVIENSMCDGAEHDPEYAYIAYEERERLHDSISSLQGKVREVIELHYFSDLSVAEIARKMGIPEGTVKWQLHDGRKKIRKGLGAMDEKIDDTLCEKVMKKVEELKLWRTKNNKDGFEEAYRDVLSDLEKLPESEKKQSAMADVLLRGWWWIPGEQNDAMLSRIREAAFAGGNEEVIDFILSKDANKFYGERYVEYIKEVQIPELEGTGYKTALGRRYYRLASRSFYLGESDECISYCRTAMSYLPEYDICYAASRAYADTAEKMFKECAEKSKDRIYIEAFSFGVNTAKDGALYLDGEWGNSYGGLWNIEHSITKIFTGAAMCDSLFTAKGLEAGDAYIGSDRSRLTFASKNETVDTPAGTFSGCELWMTEYKNSKFMTYYKDGVGIVKLEKRCGGIAETRLLSSYEILGGTGLLPLAKGNRWEYVSDISPEFAVYNTSLSVTFSDGARSLICGSFFAERYAYDVNGWTDMMEQIRSEYFSRDDDKLKDVSGPMERALSLAKTSFEKTWTAAVCSVAKRIFETDPENNPDFAERGLWNFFMKTGIRVGSNKEVYTTGRDHKWSFEWKEIGDSIVEVPLLYNDIYGIFEDAVGCLWDESFAVGEKSVKERFYYGSVIKTDISVEDGGRVTTAAGVFDRCIKITLTSGGYGRGLGYKNGKREYYFANGVGIVKVVNYIASRTKTAVYELTGYEGTGAGYMPVCDGMMRRYDAVGLTDGYAAYAVYTFAADEEGYLHMFSDRCGARRKEITTQYSSIFDELREREFWTVGDRESCRALHNVNNFKIFCHMLCRAQWYAGHPETGYSWHTWRAKMIETLGAEIPRAWLGTYAHSLFNAGAAAFALGRKKEGYEYLERALEYYPRWIEIPNEEVLEVGDDTVWGGVKVKKGACTLILPDGSEEWLGYGHVFAISSGAMYKWMSLYSWGWLDSVRDEERFKELAERAKEMMK